jgi:cysteine desulfurase / selenocysteine lyase
MNQPALAMPLARDAARPRAWDPELVRADFPALAQQINGLPLVYLDTAATALKPRSVVQATVRAYTEAAGNVHRSVHTLSERATELYEGTRSKVQTLLGATGPNEIVFVRGTTEAINLVAEAYARPRLGPGDEVLITGLEHHSNLVPWQLVCEKTGAKLRVARIDDRGDVDVESFRSALSRRTRLVAMAHVSNALGTVVPVTELAALAHDAGAVVLVDGSQAAVHLPVDVGRLGCDFYALSGHKLYGPSGVGVLWGRHELLEAMPPYQSGGDMVESVTFERTVYRAPPFRFEAGTPNIAGVIGLGAAVDYLGSLNRAAVLAHETALLDYATARLLELRGLRIIGNARHKAGVVSFIVPGIHAHDLATIADAQAVAIRAGHHCAEPVMTRFGITATARASFGLYSTFRDVDALCSAVRKAQEIFG